MCFGTQIVQREDGLWRVRRWRIEIAPKDFSFKIRGIPKRYEKGIHELVRERLEECMQGGFWIEKDVPFRRRRALRRTSRLPPHPRAR